MLSDKFSAHKFFVFCDRIFVKSDSTSKLAIIRLESKFLSSLEKEKESEHLLSETATGGVL